MTLPERILVISDIHLGLGDPDMSLFTAGLALVRFVRWAARQPGRIELVVLGDGLDYLQVEPWLGFDRATAEFKTAAILDANAEVFAAFAQFRGTPDKTLFWSVGNHDLELLFPTARSAIETRLGGPIAWRIDERPRDYELKGGAILRLIHGNGPDPFNTIDYANAAAVVKGGGDPDRVYPHGSHMVALTFNPLKQKGYRYIDLLKPEERVAFPLTMALWPEDAGELIAAGWGHFKQGLRDGVVQALAQRYGKPAPEFGRGVVEPADEQPLTGDELPFADIVRAAIEAKIPPEELLDWLDEPTGLVESLAAARAEGTFGLFARSAVAMMREAVRISAEIDPFDPHGPDAFSRSTERMNNEKVVLRVAGHTHLARFHEHRNAWYINSGTWADLMRLPPRLSRWDVKEAVDMLRHLRDPNGMPGWLRPFRRLTFVDIRLPGGTQWSARLRQWPYEDEALTIAGAP